MVQALARENGEAAPGRVTDKSPDRTDAFTGWNGVPVAGLTYGLRRSAQHSPDPLGGSAVPDEVAALLRSRRGRGAPLPAELAGDIGGLLGADLSAVSVHTDSQADQIARSVQATAFTQGTDVYFTRGRYSPGSPQGQRLLAHELAHVAQQSSGSGSAMIGRSDDPAEADADATAERVLTGLRRQAATVRG